MVEEAGLGFNSVVFAVALVDLARACHVVAGLQVETGLVECGEGVTDVLGRLGRNTHVLAHPSYLLMHVDVAFLGLVGYATDLAHELTSDLIDLLLAQVDPSLRRHDLVQRDHLLLLEHGRLLRLVLLQVDLGQEGHQELIAAQYPTPQDIRQEARQVYSPLGHVFLLVVLLAFVRFGGRYDHVRIGLDQVILQQVELLVFASHLTSQIRDLDLK